MNQYWTSHLETDEEKQRFINQLQGSRQVFDRLRQLIEMQEADIGRTERSVKAYESPSWPFLQAHKNGYASCANSIKQLLNLDHQNEYIR